MGCSTWELLCSPCIPSGATPKSRLEEARVRTESDFNVFETLLNAAATLLQPGYKKQKRACDYLPQAIFR
jgi:hypothetical protein